jgi:hypothetical protein
MTANESPAALTRCPLCSSAELIADSIPGPNLYSEKLAELLGMSEDQLLHEHPNSRCRRCGLIFKRTWFADSAMSSLFSGAVGSHPKGWDAVLNRFSAENFRQTAESWAQAVNMSALPEISRGKRELLSLIDAIPPPDSNSFDRTAVGAAIRRGDVAELGAASAAIAAAIDRPVPFSRFSGFRSQALWDYLQRKTGGFNEYAEIGCPLWGLLPMAAASGVSAFFLSRPEVNYWGASCLDSGTRCSERLLQDDSRVRSADWVEGRRFPLIGVFQYLDHPRAPRRFLRELFGRADSAAVILDTMSSPVAIQHVTGWTESALSYVARCFDKQLHADFDEIEASGNRLYLLAQAR